ncbi:type I-D CRISPR-associated helicase Cas3' [Gloeocapsa sp. PCC 73106]|uniref:type I-D CRISPR-associated helicase Cas3' n=1 Tax=Gloeocapsa sp. PCC 73106 TaxID=102232 RepID=UPI0002ACD571|nr:type I-D CRISPR-associated helicase Cas3' [Gloeocapsa sp. PCC 73106]ELR97244.1 CRISPR-associated helicase Cas3, subtype CYANO [Gloeocapsa sp. PCC 73106]
MKIQLKPLYTKLNTGIGSCPLGCQENCRVLQQAPQFPLSPGCSCPLYQHQAEAYPYLTTEDIDIVCVTSPTASGKSLLASLPSLLDSSYRTMFMYPTIELVEDQTEQQKHYHSLFNLNAEARIDRLFGIELSQRVKDNESNRFKEIWFSLQTKAIILTNPDIFHLVTHFQYQDNAYGKDELPLTLAKFFDVYSFDEFHMFGPHQETAVLNSLTLIRSTQQEKKRFLLTSATLKSDFLEQLKQANFKIIEIAGSYESEAKPGYRQILQGVELSFVNLEKEDSLSWLIKNVDSIKDILQAENNGRGLIILNSVVMARRVAQELQSLLPEIIVREVSGRIDRKERSQTQLYLQTAQKPVLIVATSAVDVGVDFRIHLLITETSDSSTIIQRLGRLGRHSGFSKYTAFLLVYGHTPWVLARLAEKLQLEATVSRQELIEVLQYAFNPPQEYQEYRNCWGSIQAQGMLAKMIEGNRDGMKNVQERMTKDLKQVYGPKLDNKSWYALGNKHVGKAIQTELLRFRGGSTLQAGVWDENRFYTYDLLRLLPYATVDILSREDFLKAALVVGHIEEAFPENYIDVYLRIEQWLPQRLNLSLSCNRDTQELEIGKLSLISRLKLDGHPQSQVLNCLSRSQILTFLVPVNRSQAQSHWDVSRHLHLNPLFGLYRLTDASEQAYACAFNQDALLLEALKWRLQKFMRHTSQSLIF